MTIRFRPLLPLALILTTLTLIGGCIMPKTYLGKKTSDGSYDCAYSSIESPEYVIDGYRDSDFSSLPTTKPIAFGPDFDRDFLDPIKTESFKFTKEEAIEEDNKLYLQTQTIEFDRVAWEWEFQDPTFIRIVTESCRTYWLELHPEIERSVKDIKRKDGKPFRLIDYQTILGANFKKFVAPPATISDGVGYNTQIISSTADSNVSLSTGISARKKAKAFKTAWVTVSGLPYYYQNDYPGKKYPAYTDDGRAWEAETFGVVTRYDPKKYFERFKDTQSAMITFPLAYIKQRRYGFEIKVRGQKFNVKGYQIKQILDELKKL